MDFNKKRKTPDSRRLTKKSKIAGDLAGTCPLTQSPSTSSSQTKNAKKPNKSRDPITPIRVSSRASRPTCKKTASWFVIKSRSPESDGTLPISIIPPAPPPSLKRKKSTSSPTKRLARNNTPSKSKWLDPNPIELTSSDDANQLQSPQKRVKHTHKRSFSSQIIDLCSESEDVIASPRLTRDETSVVVISSTDEELDLNSPVLNPLAIRETDTRESPALPAPIELNTCVPNSQSSVAKDDITDENMYAEKAKLPQGSLQALYNEALGRCPREPQCVRENADQTSPFSSLKCSPPSARNIHYATETQSPNLHTPLFFNRVIIRLRDTLKQRKTSSAKAVSVDTSRQASKLNEEQEDTLAYSGNVMKISTVNSEVPEVVAKIDFVPPIDSFLHETQAARISPSILVNNTDVDERALFQYPEFPPPLANQKNPSLEATMLEETAILDNIQAQNVSTSATPDIANFSATNTPSNPSNSDTVNYEIEALQETETSWSTSKNDPGQVATIEPIVLKDAQLFVQALRQKYNVSNISGFSLHSAVKLNDTAKPSAVCDLLSKSPTDYAMITNTSPAAISSSAHTLSASKHLSESSMILSDHEIMRYVSLPAILSTDGVSSTSESSETPTILLTQQATTLDLPLPAAPISKDISSGLGCLSESPTILNSSSLISPTSADTPGSRNSSPSTRSCQSLDSSASIESINCHLLTPDDSPSPLTPHVKVQKQEPLICSDSFPSPANVCSFDIDISEFNLQTLMGNKFDEDDDDDISISGMELTYPEELDTI